MTAPTVCSIRFRVAMLGTFAAATMFSGVVGSLPLHAASPAALVELTLNGKSFSGKVAALGERDCWLLARDGQLNRLEVDRIESHRQLSPQFRSLSATEVRDLLRREYGNGYEVAGTEHYLVCAQSGRANRFSPIFEELYRSFHRHFSVRGFEMRKPEFPLVAVVYPSRAQFAAQCRRDEVTMVPGLMGYYLPRTNRVALFDSVEAETSDRTSAAEQPPFPPFPVEERKVALRRPEEAFARYAQQRDVATELRDTIVHEATHQVAYNTGLHSRIGETPRWVIEGLATVFEAPGVREGGGGRAPVVQRINRERYLRFGNFAKSRRKAQSLKEFVTSDEMLQQATLDFYAQSWALSFFLQETRSSAYSVYVRKLAERDPLQDYGERRRLEDFEAAFGEIGRLETDFLRFMERVGAQ